MENVNFAELFLKRCNEYYEAQGHFGIQEAHNLLVELLTEARVDGVYPTKQWDYCSVFAAPNSMGFDAKLKALGQDGWELITVICNTDNYKLFIFKRPKQ